MNNKIAIIGLGYVGLPLAVEFGKKFDTIGFDINQNRIEELNNKFDCTGEMTSEDLYASTKLTLTENSRMISNCNIYIVTVPTPIDEDKKPDLNPLTLPGNFPDCFSITTEFFPNVLALSIFLIDFFAMPPDIVSFVFFSIAHLSIFINDISCRHN